MITISRVLVLWPVPVTLIIKQILTDISNITLCVSAGAISFFKLAMWHVWVSCIPKNCYVLTTVAICNTKAGMYQYRYWHVPIQNADMYNTECWHIPVQMTYANTNVDTYQYKWWHVPIKMLTCQYKCWYASNTNDDMYQNLSSFTNKNGGGNNYNGNL